VNNRTIYELCYRAVSIRIKLAKTNDEQYRHIYAICKILESNYPELYKKGEQSAYNLHAKDELTFDLNRRAHNYHFSEE
jgi:hypothetical protein